VDDASLIPRAAAGDRAAFRALVERHRTMVYRVALQYSGNHHDADDIAQEVFLKVFRSLGSFRQDAQFTSWLYRVAMNACIDHARRVAPALAASATDGEDENRLEALPADAPGPDDHAYAGELGVLLRDAIERLPPRQRLIFTMRHFEQLKLTEIAEALGLAEGTVKRQLHAAVHRLRSTLRGLRTGELL
jgi:RNA polymerase sigma-70 factor (ECF subfamily)